MLKTIYGDGVQAVEVDDEAQTVTLRDAAGSEPGIVELSLAAWREIVLGWERHKDAPVGNVVELSGSVEVGADAEK